MKLSEEVIQLALEEAARTVDGIRLAAPAGALQLTLSKPPELLAGAVLWRHHAERRPDLPMPDPRVAGPEARKADQTSVLALASGEWERSTTSGTGSVA